MLLVKDLIPDMEKGNRVVEGLKGVREILKEERKEMGYQLLNFRASGSSLPSGIIGSASTYVNDILPWKDLAKW